MSKLKGWCCQLCFNIGDKNQSLVNNEIDLCKVLSGDQPYKLPDRFIGIESKSNILTEIKISAMKSGFILVHWSPKSQKQLDKKHLAYLSLQCQHGLKYTTEKKHNEKIYKTRYSTENMQPCPFRLNIALMKETNNGW